MTIPPESGEPVVSALAPCILIADDASAVRSVCRVFLTEHGYRVLEAVDGREAVALYAAHRPDVVLLDIHMPRLDGMGALGRIKAIDPGARIVMVTAEGERDTVLAAIHAGARDYVVKPFQVRRVLAAIEKLLGSSPAG